MLPKWTLKKMKVFFGLVPEKSIYIKTGLLTLFFKRSSPPLFYGTITLIEFPLFSEMSQFLPPLGAHFENSHSSPFLKEGGGGANYIYTDARYIYMLQVSYIRVNKIHPIKYFTKIHCTVIIYHLNY